MGEANPKVKGSGLKEISSVLYGALAIALLGSGKHPRDRQKGQAGASPAPCWTVFPLPTYPVLLQTFLPVCLAGGADVGGIPLQPGLPFRLRPQPRPIRLERVMGTGPHSASLDTVGGGGMKAERASKRKWAVASLIT